MPQFPLARALAAATAAFAFACPSAAHADDPSCIDVQFIVVRGTAEPAGSSLALDGGYSATAATGVYSYARNELVNPTDGSTPMDSLKISRTDISYPAEIPWPTTISSTSADSLPFRQSVRKGTQKVIEFLNARNLICPSQRFVLLGYSQGALVVMNAITPDLSKRIMTDNAPIASLNPAAAAKVAAVATFSDIGMRHTIGPNLADAWTTHAAADVSAAAPAYLQGTKDDLTRGRNDGNSSRLATTSLQRAIDATTAHDPRIRTYCIKDDFICQGTGGAEQHLYYGDVNKPGPRRNLAIFVVQQLRNEFDKTYALQCAIGSAENPATAGQPVSLTLRIRGTVNDRAAIGEASTVQNIRGTISLTPAQQATISASLGGVAVDQTALFVRMQANFTNASTGATSQAYKTFMASNGDALAPATDTTTDFPAAAEPGLSMTWPASNAAGWRDLTLGDDLTFVAWGPNYEMTEVSCDTSGIKANEYAGRHFGRVIVGLGPSA